MQGHPNSIDAMLKINDKIVQSLGQH